MVNQQCCDGKTKANLRNVSKRRINGKGEDTLWTARPKEDHPEAGKKNQRGSNYSLPSGAALAAS